VKQYGLAMRVNLHTVHMVSVSTINSPGTVQVSLQIQKYTRCVLADNLISPSHIVFLVPQDACVAWCMLRVTYMTQTSSLRHVHVLNSVHRCFRLDTINTGAHSNVTLFEFVGVRMSVFVTVCDAPCLTSCIGNQSSCSAMTGLDLTSFL
jgi:hypothetical protein